MATYSKEKFNPNFSYGGAVAARYLGAGSIQQYSASYNWEIHKAPSGTTSMDEAWIWVWKCNSSYYLNFGWGTPSVPFSWNMEALYFPNGSTNWLLASGTLMQDLDQVGCMSGDVNWNWIHGYINRITY